MISSLSVFERSSCRCDQCAGPCRSGKPGMLAPSDNDNIAEFLAVDDVDGEFLAKNFVATTDGPGAPTDAFPDGEMPAIRPAVRKDGPRAGECVFLAENGDCTIYPVAPFECSRALECEPESSRPARQALVSAIGRSLDYQQLWKWLRGRQGSVTQLPASEISEPMT